MSQFEFVITLVSFVVAFGVSRLLAGWNTQFIHRHSRPVCGIQLFASVLLLVALLQSIWSTWSYRDAEWTFIIFCVVLGSHLAFVGAATVIHPPDRTTSSNMDHYFDVRAATYSLTTVWLILNAVLDILIGEKSNTLGAASNATIAIRAATLALFLILAVSRRPSVHWIGLFALAVLQVAFVALVSNQPAILQVT